MVHSCVVAAVHVLRILQWWGKTAKGPIFLALPPGEYAIAEGVSRVPQVGGSGGPLGNF